MISRLLAVWFLAAIASLLGLCATLLKAMSITICQSQELVGSWSLAGIFLKRLRRYLHRLLEFLWSCWACLLYLISSCFFGIFLHLHTLAILGSWVQTDGTTSQYKIGSWHRHLVSLFRDNMGQAKATSRVHMCPHPNWHHPQAHALFASISESPRGGSRFPEALSLRRHPRLMDEKMGKKRMEQTNYK